MKAFALLLITTGIAHADFYQAVPGGYVHDGQFFQDTGGMIIGPNLDTVIIKNQDGSAYSRDNVFYTPPKDGISLGSDGSVIQIEQDGSIYERP